MQISRRTLPIALAVCATLGLPRPAAADKFAGDFMAIGAGARALGMGAAFTAVANDASTVYWNPAGMSGFVKRELLLMHSEQWGNLVDYNFGSYVTPTSLVSAEREGAFGFALMHMGIDDIIVTNDLPFEDNNGNGVFDDPPDKLLYDPSNLKRESNNDFAFLGSFAAKTGWGKVGGTVKFLYTNTIAGYSATGIGLDLGYLYRGVFKNFDVGAKLQDITGTFISWSSGHNEFIAPAVKLGTAYTIESKALNGAMLLAVDGDFYFEDRQEASQFWAGSYSADLHFGAELIFQEKVMVRGGSDAGNLTAGAGFKIGSFGFDYAYLHHDDFDGTNRVSAFVQF